MKSWGLQVFLMQLRKLVAYRLDFWVNFLGQTLFSLLIAYFLWSSIFSSSLQANINGESLQSMIFYYLMAPLVFRIQQGQGIGFLSREIYDGGLNKYLLYPIDYFKFKLSAYLANSFFFTLQLFAILCIYNLFFYDSTIYAFSFLYTLYFLISLLIGTCTFFFYFSTAELLAFWFDNTWSLGVALRFITSFLGGALIPLSFFPEWSTKALAYTPFPYFINLPMLINQQKITHEKVFEQIFISILWLIVFYFISKFIWKKGNLVYSGVGI